MLFEKHINRPHQCVDQGFSHLPQGDQPPDSSPGEKDVHPQEKHYNIKTQANKIQQAEQWTEYNHGKTSYMAWM